MAHRLMPEAGGDHLTPTEIVRRLRMEFTFIHADADAGTEHVADMIAQFKRMNAPKEVIDRFQAMLGKSFNVMVSDRDDFEDDYLSFTAMPDEPPFISYCSGPHETAAAPLRLRLCCILRYRAVLV